MMTPGRGAEASAAGTMKPTPTNGAAGFAFKQPDGDTITPLLIRHIGDYGFSTDAAYLNNPTGKVELRRVRSVGLIVVRPGAVMDFS